MIAGLLFSGGKDSCLAMHKYGSEKIDLLLSLIPENKDSWMFHKPFLPLLKKQAEMLGKKLLVGKIKTFSPGALFRNRRIFSMSIMFSMTTKRVSAVFAIP